MTGDGLEKGFVSWWLGVRKNLEHHARFTHYSPPSCSRVAPPTTEPTRTPPMWSGRSCKYTTISIG